MKWIKDTNTKTADVHFAEAAVSFLSWMHPRSSPFVFTRGARQWYYAEKKMYKSFKASSNRGVNKNESFLGRMGKMIVRVEELEAMLQQLNGIFSKESGKNDNELTKLLDDLMITLFANSCKDSDKWQQQQDSFFRYIHAHLNESIPEKLAIRTFDVPIIGRNGDRTDITAQNRKRKPKMARHYTPRSRNEVVDEWLNLDAETGEGGGHSDAYVDLEDFLVEG